MSYTVKIKNLKELERAFIEAPKKVNDELQGGVKKAGAIILGREKREVPTKSGNLRRNILMVYRPISVVVYPKSSYALYVHGGTGIYGPKRAYIRPKTAQVLRFKVGGKVVYTKRTRGMKANKFVDRTAQKVQKPLNKLFDDVLNNIIIRI